MRLWGDLETYSPVPINAGTGAYAEQAEILLFAWAIDDGPVSVMDLTDSYFRWPQERELHYALQDPECELWFHNSFFDRTVLRHAAPLLYKNITPARWRDTMVQALVHGLPGKLESLCGILNVPIDQAKDRAGKQLIRLFCVPRAGKPRATRETHPVEWARFMDYAGMDVVAMRECHRRLPTWNYRPEEIALWHLDQVINDRGFAVDLDLARAAVAAVDAEQARLRGRSADLTDGQVASTTQRDALLNYLLLEHGVALPDAQAATLERRIEDPDLPAGLRELLAVRLEASTTSASKYKRLLRGVSRDGRMRGTLQFSGAQRTRRWAGRLFQPQNLPRPTAKADVIEADIEAFKAGVADIVCPSVMASASNALRGCIVAPPGRKLVVADLANIEGRMLAWEAREQWKLDAFAAFDRGEGPDLYNVAYARSFDVPVESVTGDQRQVGKVMELALGYEGGVGAFVTFAEAYRIDLGDLADRALPVIDGDVLAEAADAWRWARSKNTTYGLVERVYATCDALKRLWRRAHPATGALWRGIESMAKAAVMHPGVTFASPRDFVARRDGAWLRIKMPSGNYLCYPSPEIGMDGTLSYMGVNQYTRKWSRIETYGGKLVENATQSLARDVLAHGMRAAESAGYEVVLTVHDELITEVPDEPRFNAAGLAARMTINPAWCPDLPLAAKGFEGRRYRKD